MSMFTYAGNCLVISWKFFFTLLCPPSLSLCICPTFLISLNCCFFFLLLVNSRFLHYKVRRHLTCVDHFCLHWRIVYYSALAKEFHIIHNRLKMFVINFIRKMISHYKRNCIIVYRLVSVDEKIYNKNSSAAFILWLLVARGSWLVARMRSSIRYFEQTEWFPLCMCSLACAALPNTNYLLDSEIVSIVSIVFVMKSNEWNVKFIQFRSKAIFQLISNSNERFKPPLVCTIQFLNLMKPFDWMKFAVKLIIARAKFQNRFLFRFNIVCWWIIIFFSHFCRTFS